MIAFLSRLAVQHASSRGAEARPCTTTRTPHFKPEPTRMAYGDWAWREFGESLAKFSNSGCFIGQDQGLIGCCRCSQSEMACIVRSSQICHRSSYSGGKSMEPALTPQFDRPLWSPILPSIAICPPASPPRAQQLGPVGRKTLHGLPDSCCVHVMGPENPNYWAWIKFCTGEQERQVFT